MLIYIIIRFRDVRFALAAVIALLHDCLVVLAFYAFSRISVGTTFIACMLTLVGYSINSTIVIFDRIRELLKNANKKTNITELVNTAVSNTFVRTINTSITTLIMLIALVILGVASVKEFTIPLTVGVIVGAYSSSCLTSAAWYDMGGKKRGITEEMNKKAKEALEEAGKDAEGAQV
jgi:SecD/SecF fusion protein